VTGVVIVGSKYANTWHIANYSGRRRLQVYVEASKERVISKDVNCQHEYERVQHQGGICEGESRCKGIVELNGDNGE